jgi:hypothetical protein
LDDTPVGSIQPRNEDAVATDEKASAEPADEQETIASKLVTVQPPLEIGGEAADDVATDRTDGAAHPGSRRACRG